MLKEGKEDLDLTLAKVGQLLEAKKSVIDKELERQTQEALVKRDEILRDKLETSTKDREAAYAQKVMYKKKINKEVGRKIEEKIQGICHRKVGEQEWIDPSMVDWPDDDYRIFVGNMGNEVKDEDLAMAFQRFPSFLKAKVVRDRKSGKSKGFGFVSIGNPDDYIRAMKEMQGEYLGKRPLSLKKSDWKKRFGQ